MKSIINNSLFSRLSIREVFTGKLTLLLIATFPLVNFSLIKTALASDFEKSPLSFYQTIKRAQHNDPWLMGNKHQQSALEAQSLFAGTLADPKISIGFANVASDSFEFDQEAMSQFKVGVTQMFPRGDSRSIKQRQLRMQSEVYPFQRQDRQAKVAVTVGTLWLDLYNVQQSMALINKSRNLFEQLVEVAQASYSSSLGKTRQQDIVRAQVEVSRIEDKLVQLQQKNNSFRGQLNAWLTTNEHSDRMVFSNERIESKLPTILLQQPECLALDDENNHHNVNGLADRFSQHPALMAVDQKLKSMTVGTELAKQKYQPQWGVTASYALRDDDQMGNDRADLFSVGVVFDLPLFTENRQDQEVKATISKTEAIKTDKQLLLRNFYSSFSSSYGRLQQLLKRKALYNEKLMPQFHQQAEITLNAYTHDSGNFSEVVRARIDELNAEIDYLAIKVEQQKLHLSLNYLFVKADVNKTRFQLKTLQGGR